MTHHKKYQGTAIFMALLIIAIVVSITVVLARLQQIDIRRTQMMMASEQAYLYAQGVIDWAKGALIADMKNPQATTTWPLVLPATRIDDGAGLIAGTLQDAEGLINLNNYATESPVSAGSNAQNSAAANAEAAGASPNIPPPNPASLNAPNSQSSTPNATTKPPAAKTTNPGEANVLPNLISLLKVSQSATEKQVLIQAITDWTSSLQPNTPNVFDQQYAQAVPPYRSPHARMAGASELRTIASVTPQLYNALLPYVVALPSSTTIQTQHAPPLILQALGIPPESQQQMASTQGTATQSQYFLLRAEVILGDQHFILYSLLQRNAPTVTQTQNQSIAREGAPPITILVLWQSFGTPA